MRQERLIPLSPADGRPAPRVGSNRGMGSHQSARVGTTTWLTPMQVILTLPPFHLDPCAHPAWPTAQRLICLPDDGLAAEWEGHVWLNPPYGVEQWRWMRRLADHGDGVALIFARTETAGFMEHVWGRADAILFIRNRLTFVAADGEPAASNSGAPSCLVAYGEWAVDALSRCALGGALVTGWRRP